MDYKTGDFLLIKDETYKAKYFIGEIQKKIDKANDIYLLFIYIFPDDTIDGKKSYMSSYEVFLTPVQKTCVLDGTKEEKVEVVSLEQYINRKYKNLDEKTCPLYFKRQSYNIETNSFDPKNLPVICYCKQIFNPDIPFVFLQNGEIVHDECQIQVKKDKNIFDSSSFDDYNSYLLQKSQNQSPFFNRESLMDKSKLNVNVDGSIMSLLNKKRNIDEEDDSSNNISEKKKKIGIKKRKHSAKK